ncbi:MAG: hypothetical protein MJH09_10495 [Cetobacterium sp.]|nr:hypothetical protein [Cetobacterium sp.]
MGTMDILGILTHYVPFFKIGNIISDFIRFLLWGLVSILCQISDGVEKIVNEIYTLNNFFDKSEVQLIINKFKPALWAVLTITILYIGYKLVIDREFKGERIFQNFILAFMVILTLPTFMVKMDEITTAGVMSLKEKQGNQTTTARSIITDNIYDLKYLEKQGFNIEGDLPNGSVKTNNLNPENVLLIPINATIDRNFFDKEIFKKKVEIDENGEKSVVDLDKSFFGFIEEQYYRFNFDFLPMIIMLVSLILTFILTSIKIARIIIELAFKKVFAMMLAFGDIASGQKLKTVLKDILSSFGIIFATAVLLKLYTLSTVWINIKAPNIFVKIIFIIASSLMVIDGPNIIERVLGIDAGIKSGWSLIAGAYTGAKGIASIGSKIGNSMSAVAGGAKGIYDGFNSSTLEEESKSASNEKNSDSKSNSNENKSNSNSSNSNANSLNSNETGKSLSDESNNMQDNNQLSSNETLDNNNNISSEYGEAPSLSDDMNSNIGSSYKEQETLSENANASENNDLNNSSNTDGVQPSLESENKVNDTSLGNESSKDGVQQSLESESKSSDSLSSDMSKEGDSKSISDTEQKPLDSNIKSDNNLNSQSMNDSSNKPVGNSESLKTGKSDKDVVKNSEKLETRGLGQYAKDTLKDSKKGKIAKKHYNLGINTGKAFRNYMDKKRGKGSK